MLKKCIVITISSIAILFIVFFIALSYEDAISLTTEVNRLLSVMIITASGVMIAITKISISDMDKSPISSTKILALSKLANIFLNLNNVIWLVSIIAGIFVYKLDSLFVYRYFFPNITVVHFMIFVIVSVLKDKSTY